MTLLIKIIGAIIIVISSTSAGFYIANQYTSRSRNIFYFINALSFIMTEISYNKTYIVDILPKLDAYKLGDVGIFFKNVYSVSKSTNSGSLKHIFIDCLERERKRLCFKEAETKILQNFFISLGTSDTQTQIKNIESTIYRLEEIKKASDEVCKKNTKLSKVCGLLSGLAVSLILF